MKRTRSSGLFKKMKRKPKRKRFSGYDLPGELEEQILVKLPVKSMLRFRSVCKSWNSIIINPKFVKDHLKANIHKSNTAFCKIDASSSVFEFPDPPQLYNIELVENRVLSLPTFEEINRLHSIPGFGLGLGLSLGNYVSGCHSNGIVCLVDKSSNQEHQVVLYNPALRQHERIQNPSPSTFKGFGFGFGYDHKTDDHKFVGIKNDKAVVYALRTGLWREIKVEQYCPVISTCGVYVKGCCYWLDYVSMNILYFDMSEEIFGRVDLPRCQTQMRLKEWFAQTPSVIARGADSLAFIVNSEVYPWSSSFEIWVMDGDRGGWSQHYKIEPLEGLARPLSFWKEDEVLIEGQGWWISSYNLRTKILTRIPDQRAVKRSTAFGSLYFESLVSVKPEKEQ